MKTSKNNRKIATFIEKLDLLKDKLLTEKDFGDIYSHFLDHLGEDETFQMLGNPVQSPFLHRVVETIGKEVTGAGQISKMLLLKVPQYPFLHGPLLIDNCMGTLFYFEDIEVGLISICLPNMETHFTRISTVSGEKARIPRRLH